jgi:hypothetical protein
VFYKTFAGLYTGLWIYDDYPGGAGSVPRCRSTWRGYPGYVLLAWSGSAWALNVGGAFMPELYRTGAIVDGVPEFRRAVYNSAALQQWIAAGEPGSPMISVGTDAITDQQMASGVLQVCRLANRGALGLYVSSQSFAPYVNYPPDRVAWITWALNQCTG